MVLLPSLLLMYNLVHDINVMGCVHVNCIGHSASPSSHRDIDPLAGCDLGNVLLYERLNLYPLCGV